MVALADARELAAKQHQEAVRQQAEEEAKYKAELERMRAAAEEARRKAEEAAARAKAIEEQAERERKAEEERLEQERQRERQAIHDADFRRKDFNIAERLRQLGVTESSKDIKIEARTAQGWLTKLGQVSLMRQQKGEKEKRRKRIGMGKDVEGFSETRVLLSRLDLMTNILMLFIFHPQFRKNWRQRWFVVDLDNMVLRYQTSEESRKEKATIPINEVVRVFKPRSSSFQAHHAPNLSKHQNLIMIEVGGAGNVLCGRVRKRTGPGPSVGPCLTRGADFYFRSICPILSHPLADHAAHLLLGGAVA